jgi:hypothetical protein
LPVDQLHTRVEAMDLGSARAFHLPDWHLMTHPQRLEVMRQIATMRGRDPVMAKKAVTIIQAAGVAPREYEKQAAALLAWVQDPKNVYYVNEPGERLQDPLVTIQIGMGDCDDLVLLLNSLFESIGLPWRQVLSGLGPADEKVRWIEGHPVPDNCRWTHIYTCVGTPPFGATTWYFCEPTIRGVPLGWDVVSGDARYLPEMRKRPKGPARLVGAPAAPRGFRPYPIPQAANRSAAYDLARFNSSSSNVAATVGGAVAEQVSDTRMDWSRVALAVGTGVAVSVGTQITLDIVRPLLSRLHAAVAARWRARA